jgi:murein L,D-transpeptidase YafK
MLSRCLLAVFLLCFAITGHASASPTLSGSIDKVLVLKSERKLQLLQRGEPVRTYRISLGKQPVGHKAREGDLRTPEGFYWIDWRRVSQSYHLSMHISYPNARDRSNANANGHSPGSMIMLHGTPTDEEYPEWYFHTLDWTEGCIALKNSDMREVWNLVKDGTLIEIRP